LVAKELTEGIIFSDLLSQIKMLQYLSVKIIFIFLFLLRLLTLLYLLFVFARCILFFAETKVKVLQARGNQGISKLNYTIIAIIYLILLARLVVYLIINIISIILIIQFEDNSNSLSQNDVWITCRGILAPIYNLVELILVCYMIYHQDNRNRAEGRKVKKKFNKI